jgi:acetylornithine deacetylase
LSGHTDVVPVDGQTWSSDPFRVAERDGRLFGRGTADMKGFLACCLAMVPGLAEQRLAHPIHLAFSYDEEVGCVGVRGLIERLDGRTVKPLMCIVGEPTEMQVVIGHKGKRSFQATVRGRTCHSSLAPHGVNAVEYAARLIVKIREMADRLAVRGARDSLYEIPYTTAHTGVAQGGTALNIVPDACAFEFEFRVIADDKVDALEAEVKTYARNVLEPEMKAIAPEAGITFAVKSGFPGLNTASDGEAAVLAKQLAERNDHGKVAFGSEAGLFDAAGIPTVIIGPGSIKQAHTADEFIAVAELEKCNRFLDRLIAHCRE